LRPYYPAQTILTFILCSLSTSQKHVRGYIAKLRFLSLLRVHHAARTLQYRWRSKTARRLVRAKASLQVSVTTMQRVWRGFQMRCRLACAAAVKIQAIWRGFFVQLQYQIDLMDIITIQCRARMVLAKKERVGRYNAVQVLQEEQLQSQRICNMAASKCQVRSSFCIPTNVLVLKSPQPLCRLVFRWSFAGFLFHKSGECSYAPQSVSRRGGEDAWLRN
jgi:hypothetical protein